MYQGNSSLYGYVCSDKNIGSYRFRDICEVGKVITRRVVARDTARLYSARKKARSVKIHTFHLGHGKAVKLILSFSLQLQIKV